MPQYRALKKSVESTSEILINKLSPEVKIAITEILVDPATDKNNTKYIEYSNNTLNSNNEVQIIAVTKISFDDF
jgi:hypothetical protein